MPRASSSDLAVPEDKLLQGMHTAQGQIRLSFQQLQDTIYNGQFHCFVVVCWVLEVFNWMRSLNSLIITAKPRTGQR